MKIKPNNPTHIGITFFTVHFILCVIVFLAVQFSKNSQSGFVWFAFFYIDYPVASVAYTLLEKNVIMSNLIEWWYTIGNHQGPNIRAIIIFGIFGSVQWFIIGWLFTFVVKNISSKFVGNK